MHVNSKPYKTLKKSKISTYRLALATGLLAWGCSAPTPPENASRMEQEALANILSLTREDKVAFNQLTGVYGKVDIQSCTPERPAEHVKCVTLHIKTSSDTYPTLAMRLLINTETQAAKLMGIAVNGETVSMLKLGLILPVLIKENTMDESLKLF